MSATKKKPYESICSGGGMLSKSGNRPFLSLSRSSRRSLSLSKRTIPVRNVTGHLLRSERTDADGRHNAAASRTYTCPKTSIRREDRTMCAIPFRTVSANFPFRRACTHHLLTLAIDRPSTPHVRPWSMDGAAEEECIKFSWRGTGYNCSLAAE